MKKNITSGIALALALCSFKTILAQQAVGLYAGNHTAPYSSFQNPANAFPDRNRVYINFWGANVGFTNNFLTYDAPFGLVRAANGNFPDAYKTSGGLLNFDQNWLQWEKNNNAKLYYLSEVYGPSIYFRASRKTSLGFGLRGISGLSMTGISPEASRMLRYGLDSNSLTFNGTNALAKNTTYSNGKFSIAAEKYQEWYFTLATVTKDKGPHFVKWGATGKLLLGMGSAGIHGSGFDFGFNGSNQMTLNNANLNYYHTNDASASSALSAPFGLKFDFLNGAGAGMDLGFVYEYRPETSRKTVKDWWTCADEKKNDYDWKFGASITDLGFISYNGSQRVVNQKSSTWNINTALLNQKAYLQGIDDRFASVDQGFFDDTAIQAGINDRFTVATPVALNAQLDLNLKNNFYVGLNWSQSLKSTQSAGLRKTSYISAVPRWESEHVEVGMPITLTRDYTALNVGLYGRVGPVVLGTDNLAGLASFIGNGAYKAANVYFAVRMQIPACGWRYYEQEKLHTDTMKADTLYQHDSTEFWNHDTIRIEKIIRDTIKIQKTDTVKIIEYRNKEVGVGNAQKEEELRQKELALKKKEDELKAREADVTKKETTNMGKSDDCTKRIADLEDQLRKERDLYSKLNVLYQNEKDEKERLRLSILDLENQISGLKAENSGLKAQVSDDQAEIYKLRQDIARLKATNKPCDAQVKTLDSLLVLEEYKNTELQKENSKQKAEITGKQSENDQQKKRIAELEEQIRVLKVNASSNTDCADKLAKLQADLDNEKAKSGGLQKQLDDLRNEYQFELAKNKELEDKLKNCGNSEEAAKLKADLDAQKKQTDDLAAKIVTMETENSSLKATVTAKDKEIADLKAQIAAANAKILDLQEKLKNCGSNDEAAKLKAELDAEKKKNDDLNGQLGVLQSDNNTLKGENSTLKAKVSGLEKDLADIKVQLDAQSKKVLDLQEQLKNCGDADQIAALKAQVDDLKKQNSEKDAQISGLKADKAKLESDLSTAKAKITSLESDLKDCQSKDCGDLEAQLADYKAKYENAKNQYDAVYAEYNSLLADYKKLQSQLADCQKQLKDCGSNSDDVSKLEAEVAKLKLTITELNGQLDSKQKSLDELQSAYDKSEADKATLQKQINTLNAQVKNLNAQVADLQAQLKACKEAGNAPGGSPDGGGTGG